MTIYMISVFGSYWVDDYTDDGCTVTYTERTECYRKKRTAMWRYAMLERKYRCADKVELTEIHVA